MNIVLARLGGNGCCPIVNDLLIIVFQYWLNVTSEKALPAVDVNNRGTSRPDPWVMS